MSRAALRAAAPPRPEAEVAPLEVALEPLIERVVRRVLGERTDGLVDLAQAVPVSRRVLFAACRTGKIQGAVRCGRKWLCPKSALDAWLQTQGPRLVKRDQDGDALEGMRRRLARSR